MKNKIVAAIVALGGFASLAAVTADAKTVSTCPPGTAAGSIYCTVTVLPQGPPSLFHEELWAEGHHYYYGPALKFKVKNGLNAPGIRKVVFTLPSGFYVDPRSSVIKYDLKHGLSYKGSTLTETFKGAPLSVLVYVKNHGILENATLRKAIKEHLVKTESFKVHVYDTTGLETTAVFSVKAQDSK